VYAVGSATARAAREAGFRNVLSADGDVVALANGIAARKSDLHGIVLHPGASEPAGDLVGALASHGIEARRLDLYDTLPAALTDDRQAAIGQAVLADVLDTMPAGQLKVLAISEAALRPLERSKLAFKAFAPFPLEAALLNLIDRTP
jgi:uroporphyrinogen-III synthase